MVQDGCEDVASPLHPRELTGNKEVQGVGRIVGEEDLFWRAGSQERRRALSRRKDVVLQASKRDVLGVVRPTVTGILTPDWDLSCWKPGVSRAPYCEDQVPTRKTDRVADLKGREEWSGDHAVRLRWTN